MRSAAVALFFAPVLFAQAPQPNPQMEITGVVIETGANLPVAEAEVSLQTPSKQNRLTLQGVAKTVTNLQEHFTSACRKPANTM